MWEIFASSTVGPHHERRGEKSQDFYTTITAETPAGESVALAVVADGAGSLKDSLQGARFACHILLIAMRKAVRRGEFTEGTMEELFAATREKFLALKNHENMGCTVAAVALGETFWAAGALGDSFVVLHQESGEHEFLQPEKHGEYANVTQLLGSAKVNPVFAYGAEKLRGASASTDGLQRLSVQGAEPVKGFWDNLLVHMEGESFAMADFLQFLKERELLDDDSTLVTCLGAP